MRASIDDFVAREVEIVKGYKLGKPKDSETTHGPLESLRIANGVRTQIAEVVVDGAVAHIGIFVDDDDGGAHLTVQILTVVTHNVRVMRDESFDPVVEIMKVVLDEEAIALLNGSEFGLTASFWTRDVDRAMWVGENVETGIGFMNRVDYLDPGLCWTGARIPGGARVCPSSAITT